LKLDLAQLLKELIANGVPVKVCGCACSFAHPRK